MTIPNQPTLEINESFEDSEISIREIKEKIRKLNDIVYPSRVKIKRFYHTTTLINKEYGGSIEAFRDDYLSDDQPVPFMWAIWEEKKTSRKFTSLKTLKKEFPTFFREVNFKIKSHCISVFSWLQDSLDWNKKYSNLPEFRIPRESKARIKAHLENNNKREKELIEKSQKDVEKFQGFMKKFMLNLMNEAVRVFNNGGEPFISHSYCMMFVGELKKLFSSEEINSFKKNERINENWYGWLKGLSKQFDSIVFPEDDDMRKFNILFRMSIDVEKFTVKEENVSASIQSMDFNMLVDIYEYKLTKE